MPDTDALDIARQALGFAIKAQAVANAATNVAAEVWVTVSMNILATSGQFLSVNTTAGPVTITLPAGGGSVSLRDDAGTWGTNPVTINGNGLTIDGSASELADITNYRVDLTSFGSEWRYGLRYLYGA